MIEVLQNKNIKELSRIKIGLSGNKKNPFIVLVGGYVTLTNGERMYIPKGFEFDNGSIPKIFKFLYDTFKIEFFNYLCKAFLIHDLLYNNHGYQVSPKFLIRPCSRAFADDQMKHFIEIKNLSKAQIQTYYLAVRFFGRIAWNRNC